MTLQFDAVYENGVLRPTQPLVLPNGSQVRVAITTSEEATDPLADVLGIVEGPAAGDAAENHDDYTYGR